MKVVSLLGPAGLAEERAWLAASLADLCEMGLPLDEAVGRLAAEIPGRSRFGRAVGRMHEVLRRGGTLSYAAATSPVLPPRWGRLLGAAEARGDLASPLRSLARLELREPSFPFGAAVGAALTLLALAALAGFLGACIMPTFLALRESGEAPAAVRLLAGFAAFARSGVPISLAGGTLVLVGLLATHPARGAALLAHLGGRAAALRDQAFAASVIAAALRQGVPVVEAVEAASEAAVTPPARAALAAMAADPSTSLGDALARRADFFDSPLILACRLADSDEALADALEAGSDRLIERADGAAIKTRESIAAALSVLAGAATALVACGVFEALSDLAARLVEAVLP
jgi:type II secretory pathway component PulF